MRICAHQLGHQAALPHVTIGPDCTRVGQGFLMTTRCLPPAQFGRRHRLPGGKWLCVSGGTPRQSPHPDPRARLKASLPTTMTTLEGDRLLQHAAQLRTVCKKVPPPTSSSVGFPSKRRCHCGGGGAPHLVVSNLSCVSPDKVGSWQWVDSSWRFFLLACCSWICNPTPTIVFDPRGEKYFLRFKFVLPFSV